MGSLSIEFAALFSFLYLSLLLLSNGHMYQHGPPPPFLFPPCEITLLLIDLQEREKNKFIRLYTVIETDCLKSVNFEV